MQNGGTSLGGAVAIYEECSFIFIICHVLLLFIVREANRIAPIFAKFNEFIHEVCPGDARIMCAMYMRTMYLFTN